MRQGLSFLISLCLLIIVTGTLTAQEPDPPPRDGWRATYWNNPSLAGFWRLRQIESEPLNRNWGEASPADEINPSYWSARWERMIRVAAGNYRFTATADNGIRVYVDGDVVIDAWTGQWQRGGETFVGDVVLGGDHLLVVEYFDTTGEAYIQLSWEPYVGPPAVVEGWLAEYYNNIDLAGAPVLMRDEPEIRLDLQANSPLPGTVNADNFSARWTREIELPAGQYEFSMRVDDGGRLYVDGALTLDGWRPQGPTVYTARVTHPGGPMMLVMEYFEQTGHVVAELSWERIGDLPAPISANAVIVDDDDSGFVWGNPFIRRIAGTGGYGGRFIGAANQQQIGNGYAWARWYPALPAGEYDVYVFVPELAAGSGQATTSARYWVQHTNQYTLQIVDQAANVGRWVSLGRYEFQGNEREYISLAGITGEPTGATVVLWDAIRWEPVE